MWDGGATPVVVVNKVDLCDDAAPYLEAVEAVAFGTRVALVSALDGRGIEALAEHVGPGVTAALVGSSGVGKSTLVNRLLGREVQETAAIRESDARGRHTTTRRELLSIPGGGLLIDTPGMRELELDAGEGGGLEATFEDLEALAAGCRFRDCAHDGEPGCAVQTAIAAGELDAGRLASYRKLQREIAHTETRKDAAYRREQRLRGKRMAAIVKEAKKRKIRRR